MGKFVFPGKAVIGFHHPYHPAKTIVIVIILHAVLCAVLADRTQCTGKTGVVCERPFIKIDIPVENCSYSETLTMASGLFL